MIEIGEFLKNEGGKPLKLFFVSVRKRHFNWLSNQNEVEYLNEFSGHPVLNCCCSRGIVHLHNRCYRVFYHGNVRGHPDNFHVHDIDLVRDGSSHFYRVVCGDLDLLRLTTFRVSFRGCIDSVLDGPGDNPRLWDRF